MKWVLCTCRYTKCGSGWPHGCTKVSHVCSSVGIPISIPTVGKEIGHFL